MNERVLLIEDNEQNAYLATFLLGQAGMVVTHARSGDEGLRVAREQPHDIVLLDIQLPELDGYQIARVLRQDPAFKDIPLLALTSYAMAGERQKAMDAGFDGYIEKPISPLKLVDQVRSFLLTHEDSDR